MRSALALSTGLGLALSVLAPEALGQQPAAPPKLVADSGPRTPEEERSGFHLPEGFAIELVASEPAIGKPMNLAFDARGRLWVTSTVEYPYPVKEGVKGRDRVVILGDFADDGHARSVSTFADGLNIPIGVLPIGRGDSALVHSIPNILRLEDLDGDGKSDRSRPIYGTYGFRDTHGMTNAFTRGFDGWIYACHGFSNESKVEGSDQNPIVMQSGNVYRMKADGSHVEYFSHGQVNPFGLAFDPMGNLYSCDCHSRPIYQLLRGAYYPSFGKPDDGLGFGPEMIGHDHGSTGIGGIATYAADHFPEAFRDTIFIGNVVTSRINHDSIEWHGSSPKAIARPDFVVSDDPWFRPVDIELGPDGALYVADFYNRIIGHYEVPLTHPGRDRERGRIWRISYKGADGKGPAPKAPRADWTLATVPDLVGDLGHPNLAVRTLAADELVARGPAVVDSTRAVAEGGDRGPAWARVHALWVLHRLGMLGPMDLSKAASSIQEPLRVHAARILAERPTLEASGRLLAMAGLKDASANVRRASAEALGRHPSVDQVRPLIDLIRGVEAADGHLKHVARMALRDQFPLATGAKPSAWEALASMGLSARDEAIVADVALGVPSLESARFLLAYLPGHAEPLARRARFARHVARFGEAGSEAGLVAFARSPGFKATDRVALLKAIQQGTQERGGSLGADSMALALEIARALIPSADANEAKAGVDLAGSLRLIGARDALAAVVADDKRPVDRRSAALVALVAVDPSSMVGPLGVMVRDASGPIELREQAATSLAGLGRPEGRSALVEALATAPARLQSTIAAGLAQDRAGAEALLAAVAAGKASARPLGDRAVAVRLEAARIPDLKARLDALLKDLPPADQRVQALIQRRRAAWLAAPGDPARGALVFEKTCAACHQMEGKGAKVGPQLDGVGARGVDRLLEDVLDPNRNVDQAFRVTNLGLDDGRVVSGLLLRQDGELLVLADAKGQEIRVPAAAVQDRKLAQISPMPADIAEQIAEADFNHLMAYLLLGRKP